MWCELDDLHPGEYDPDNDVCDLVVLFPDGRRYRMKVCTFRHLQTRLEADRESGEHLGGKYLVPPELLVERLDRALIESAVADLLERDEIDFEALEEE